MIAKYVPGTFLDEADKNFVLHLFAQHPEYARKAGAGISRVEVRLDVYGNKHFQVHRIDGTDEDISWVYCITQAR